MAAEVAELARAVRAGDRRALSRAITLVESTLPEQRGLAESLLEELGPVPPALRVGVSGPPGAGKSTFVDAFGDLAVQAGRRLAVLAIDPASSVTHGSLLGDVTRMERLNANAGVFIRGSSNRGALGGTAPRTSAVAELCEAAGYDLLLIETVGVGQAEQAVRSVCDCLLVLALAGAGDELQGMKRGLLEVADALVVNKADGEGEIAARDFAQDLSRALELLRPDSPPHVVAVSARTGSGLPPLLAWLFDTEARLRGAGELERRRAERRLEQFRSDLAEEIRLRLGRHAGELAELEGRVARGDELPSRAARELVDRWFAAGRAELTASREPP